MQKVLTGVRRQQQTRRYWIVPHRKKLPWWDKPNQGTGKMVPTKTAAWAFVGQLPPLGIYLEQQHGRQHTLFFFKLSADSCRNFPSCLRLQREPAASVIRKKPLSRSHPSCVRTWLITPLHLFHRLENKTSTCLCSALLTNSPVKALQRCSEKRTRIFVVLGGFLQQFCYFLARCDSKWGLCGSVPLLGRAGAQHFTNWAWQDQTSTKNWLHWALHQAAAIQPCIFCEGAIPSRGQHKDTENYNTVAKGKEKMNGFPHQMQVKVKVPHIFPKARAYFK